MKRYKLDVEHCNVAGWGLRPIEDLGGEWVTWEDHIKSQSVYDGEILCLRNEIRRLKTSTVTAEGGVIKVRDVTECNCAEMAAERLPGPGRSYIRIRGDEYSFIEDWWMCPRHG